MEVKPPVTRSRLVIERIAQLLEVAYRPVGSGEFRL